MVGLGGTLPRWRKENGGDIRGPGRVDRRGRGREVGGDGEEPKTWYMNKRTKYIIGTDFSVSMASVLGFDLHKPIISTL